LPKIYYADKLLFKKYLWISGFASINDKMTGDSTPLSILQCKYRLVVPILSGQHHTKERFLLFFLDTVKTYQNYRVDQLIF
jgi:hypothetical protein